MMTGESGEVRLYRFSVLAAATLVFALAACGEDSNTYEFSGVLSEKYRDDGSSEPMRLVFDVSLNRGKPKSVDCRVKNMLKPLWDGLYVGAKVKFTKTSNYKYRENTFCGLLNDAVVKEVLDHAAG